MNKKILKIINMFFPVAFGVCFVIGVCFWGGKKFSANILEAEQDYRLKFVDSTDFLALSESDALILPFEILSVQESQDGIIVKTHENAVVFSPIDCKVVSNNTRNNEIELKCNNLSVTISGLVSGVTAGQVLECGAVIGTVMGESCLVNVCFSGRKLSLEELRSIL